MRKSIFSIVLLLATVLGASAMSVTTAPGELSKQVGDKNVIQLIVTGSVDVRDFAFIADNLLSLSLLDMSGVEVEAYTCRGDECYFGSRSAFAAGELPQYAFFGSALRSVTLPAQLSGIGEAAFAGCSALEAISIPESVTTIGENAFNSSGLKQVAVNVRQIGAGAFADCTQLASVQMGQNVLSIGDRAFAGCTKLTTVGVPEGSPLHSIGEEAFMGSALASFDFALCPNVEKVGKWAFAGTKIKKAKLPESLADVPEGVFFGSASVDNISVPEYAQTIGDYAYYGNTSRNNSLKLPVDLSYIGDNAFEGSRPSYVVAYPLTVPELGKEAFKGMNGEHRTVLYVEKASIPSYQSASQWSDFDIQDIAATDAPMAGADLAIRAWFDGSTLCITASDEIESVSIFDDGGTLCGTTRGNSCEVRIDTSAITSGIVLAAVKLEGGETRAFKLLRK